MIEIDENLRIPPSEITFTFARSGGPGGQNVNKVSSRATLLFDVDASSVLDDSQKARIRERLAGRINDEGILRVTSQKHRSQSENRAAAEERFAELLRSALAEQKPRKKTKPSRAARQSRIEEKKRQGERKKQRAASKLHPD